MIMTPPPPRYTPFPTRRSSDLAQDRTSAERHRADARRSAHPSGVGRDLVLPAEQSLRLDRRQPHRADHDGDGDRKSTRLNSSHVSISYAVFCLKKKKKKLKHNM